MTILFQWRSQRCWVRLGWIQFGAFLLEAVLFLKNISKKKKKLSQYVNVDISYHPREE